MICDNRNHLMFYGGLSPQIDIALLYLAEINPSRLPIGKYPVNEDKVFALVQEPCTGEHSECRWESHKRYIDLQYLVSGQERIGFQSTDSLTILKPYDAGRDIAFYRDNDRGFFPLLNPGSFVVCFPHEAHMPLVCENGPRRIKKIVMKIEVPESNC
jgi:YhcH/YjgK/YiaL family protein